MPGPAVAKRERTTYGLIEKMDAVPLERPGQIGIVLEGLGDILGCPKTSPSTRTPAGSQMYERAVSSPLELGGEARRLNFV